MTAAIALICAVCIAAAVVVGFLAESGSMGQVAQSLGLNALGGAKDLEAGADAQGKVLSKLPGPTANPNVDKGIGGLTGPTANPSADSGVGGWGLHANQNGDSSQSSGSSTDGTGSGASDVENGTASDPALSALPAGALSPITVSEAAAEVSTLQSTTPHPQGYNREKYFGGWENSPSLCGTGSTRDVILLRDLTDTSSNKNCKVQSGSFHDPYTDTSMTFKYGRDTSGLIQIDHVVALQDAWASGLWKADDATRKAYANDPEVLVASQGEANNEKSMGVNLYGPGVARSNNGKGAPLQWKASTPSVWLPSNQAYQCSYMAKRVYIKHKYNLSMSDWEKSETTAFLNQCATK